MTDHRFLIGDIGGTNIRLAWFWDDPRQRNDEIIYRVEPKTKKPYEILPAVKEYVAKVEIQFTAACLGMAGELQSDSIRMTNRADIVQRKDIAAILNLDPAKVLLINDMPPHLACVDLLKPSELVEIHAGIPNPSGSRAVLMPGTGVGVGGAVSVGESSYHPFPSEGGHIDFAPRDEQQDRLLQFLRPLAVAGKVNHVSNEFVFAGEGIRRIYAFLQNPDSKNLDGIPRSDDITAALSSSELPADDIRQRTVEMYMRILGAAAGNLALMFAATGGVYLGGNICLSLRKYLTTPAFLESFLNRGPPTHRQMVQSIRIQLIDYKDSGLLGAGALAKRLVAQ